MMHHYLPHTQHDIDVMLKHIGVDSLDELYVDVPESLKLKKQYNLPEPQSEKEIRDFFDTLGDKNLKLKCFAGGGYYNHYASAVVQAIISRSEFLTAYTPYQPEISQGTLQYIFEYQTIMSRLTGLDVSNASMYDGATATAEAMLMAVAHSRRRNRVLISATVNPAVKEVVETYARYHNVVIDTIAADNGVTSRTDFESKLASGDVAGVIVSAPNYYGIVEDYTGWADACHAAKSLFIMNAVAIDLASIKSPGEWGADIAVGDAQSLGMPLNYGGPYLGYLCATNALMRKMPGRIVGATTDSKGTRVFVLTLQAREQHIRREKATSNICSNQGLMALYATVYASLMGTKGLKEVNTLGYNAAHYLADKLCETGKMKLTYPDRPFFNEMLMTVDFDLNRFFVKGIQAGILPGIKVGENTILIAATEMLTRAEIDSYVQLVKTM